MAIAQFEEFVLPPPDRARMRGFAKQTRASLNLVPDLDADNSKSVSGRAFIGILIGVFAAGLLILLSINTALTSGAFTLENVKLQLAAINDQRDALLNQVATFSSPNRLSSSAIKMGMQPQAAINFLTLPIENSK